MSSRQLRIASVTEMRLAAIAAATASLKAQLSELEGLRDQVRKAELARRLRGALQKQNVPLAKRPAAHLLHATLAARH